MRKRISLKFLEGYILIGILGFLFITLVGSYMIESALETGYQRKPLSGRHSCGGKQFCQEQYFLFKFKQYPVESVYDLRLSFQYCMDHKQ